MASQSQIVPSKNALRALRKLALGGSTVVGAVGSISGLACVSYDIRQRIQLAESIVETKRVLHSQPISNPNRKAQMAAVFEMYEKGQGKEGNESWRDFNRRARRHSAQDNLHKGRELVDTVIVADAVHRADVTSRPTHCKPAIGARHIPLGRATTPALPADLVREQTRITLEEAASSCHNQNSLAAQRIIEATQKAHKINSHAVYGRPRESLSISPVQGIATATQREHKLSSDVVFARPTKRKDEGLRELATCVWQWLAPTDISKLGVTRMTASKRPSVQHKAVGNNEPARHHSTVTAHVQDNVENPSMWLNIAESQIDDPFFGKVDIAVDEGENGSGSRHSSLQPVQKTKTSIMLEESSTMPEESELQRLPHTQPVNLDTEVQVIIQDVANQLMALIQSALWVPDTTVEKVHDISAYPLSSVKMVPLHADSRANVMVGGTAETGKLDVDNEPSAILEHFFTMIPNISRRDGRTAAREFLVEALKIYAQGGRSEDLRAIDRLYSKFATTLRLPFVTPVRQMVQFLLCTGLDEDRHRAGRILFPFNVEDIPKTNSAAPVIKNVYDQNALKYIDWLCSGRATKSRIVHEFRKVLEVIYQRCGTPTEAMFSPLLKLFFERGDMKYLQNMFEEMKSAHGVEPSSYTRRILLAGYAKANDWGQIVSEFEKMHRDGLSRREPMGYAAMFNEVFRQHAISEPVEKTHDFLVNAICYWGLVPSTAISGAAVQTYIRYRRYDLIKEWIEAARHMFPDVNVGGEAFAYTLGQTWGEIGASCEEIEDTCESIFRGLDNHVVPGRFKATVGEALAYHLARKLHAINADEEVSNDEKTKLQTPTICLRN